LVGGKGGHLRCGKKKEKRKGPHKGPAPGEGNKKNFVLGGKEHDKTGGRKREDANANILGWGGGGG